MGKKIRIYHRGVQKLFTNCYGAHARRNCRSKKVRWIDYVLRFMDSHQEIPGDYYGRWLDVLNKEFGEIVEERGEEDQTDNHDVDQSMSSSNRTGDEQSKELMRNPAPVPPSINKTEYMQAEQQLGRQRQNQNATRISRDEEDLLSNFLSFGMAIDEAKEAHHKEQEMAELKQRMKDHKRAAQS